MILILRGLRKALEAEPQRHLNLSRAADRLRDLSQARRTLVEVTTHKWISAVGRTGGWGGHCIRCVDRRWERAEAQVLRNIVNGYVKTRMVRHVVNVEAI